VVNDGSTDGGETDRIAKSYGSRIRYICKENGGVSTALNTGIRNMRGEYFSWLSHDDVYTPDKVEKAVQALSALERKDTVIYCQSMHIDKNSVELGGIHRQQQTKTALEPWDTALMNLLQSGSMNGCAFLLHRTVFEKCGLFDETLRFNQDGFMWTNIFLRQYPLFSIADVCVKNRIHDKQLTQTGQSIFRGDCEKMSKTLIPALLQISTRRQNFLLAYTLYHAKYGNRKIVRAAYNAASEVELLAVSDKLGIIVQSLYGLIRPYIRKVYYMLFRKIRTT